MGSDVRTRILAVALPEGIYWAECSLWSGVSVLGLAGADGQDSAQSELINTCTYQ